MKLQVKLVSFTPQPEKLVYVAARIAYSRKALDELWREAENAKKVEKFLKMLYDKGHHSVFEHASFTFLIEGCSRVCTHQLIRHRIASYTQQSQRYAGVQNSFSLPPSLENDERVKKLLNDAQALYETLLWEGVKEEDARYIIPQAVTSRLITTMNFRELMHFIELRSCLHAQLEIRRVAWMMALSVRGVSEILGGFLGASCVVKGVCRENDTECVMWKVMSDE